MPEAILLSCVIAASFLADDAMKALVRALGNLGTRARLVWCRRVRGERLPAASELSEIVGWCWSSRAVVVEDVLS